MGAAGLGFEPRLTDPESVVLPLHPPLLYEKVFQSLTKLALKLLTDDPSKAIRFLPSL